jgi:Tfp pilus assembly protein PilX
MNKQYQKGVILVYLIIVIAVFSILMLPLLDIAGQKIKILRSSADREQALQIAEAGINYYQWHLAHFQNDYFLSCNIK